MISTVRTLTSFCLAGVILLTVHSARAADDEQQKITEPETKDYSFKDVTTPEGLHFRIPEDMPIETRGGLKGPIPFDEYLYSKFRKLEDKVTELDKKIDKLQNSMDFLQEKLKPKSDATQETAVAASP